MRLRTWRGTTVVNPTPRRSFPWVRLLVIALILGIAAYLIIPNLNAVRADALVQGDLIPVTPVYRARVDRLLVSCTDHVRAGQPVAVISNFLLQADYQRQYLQGLQQSQIASIALDQNVATARENAETLHQKYLQAVADQRRLQGSLRSYDAAYKEGALPRVDWEAKHAEVDIAQANVQATAQAWKTALQFVNQISATQASRVSSDQQLLAQAQSVANRLGQEKLVAPVTGSIVQCVERPQNVIEAGTPLFSIFQPERAYIVAYFSPGAVSKVHVGQSADVNISGLDHKVEGRVAFIYPNLDALPPELTRFFWQHVQFSQYRPVKIALDRLPQQEREQLYYNAQARVNITTSEQKAR